MREHGVLVAVSVEGGEYEASYYFPRVPVPGEALHFMNMSGSDPLGLGDATDWVVSRVQYAGNRHRKMTHLGTEKWTTWVL